ncbi:hypothetical protein [Actinomadura macrotermitis]|uniref:hypothetical protein n=1 Tax=Actinomadura macrotermitis TaxID=2585200 RepID=UPI0012959532|nr:hypothetical protein [Actinomadura macrotermitis]
MILLVVGGALLAGAVLAWKTAGSRPRAGVGVLAATALVPLAAAAAGGTGWTAALVTAAAFLIAMSLPVILLAVKHDDGALYLSMIALFAAGAVAFFSGVAVHMAAPERPAGTRDRLVFTTEPVTPVNPRGADRVRAAATALLKADAAGDAAGVWNLWTTAGQRLMSQKAYTRLLKRCRPLHQGAPYTITSVRVKGDTATVRTVQAGTRRLRRFALEQGEWRLVLAKKDARDYRLGVKRLVAKRKNLGLCAA